ncbi:hypothetical protein SARC_12437, partial [Sphaeroforma arctica JP610]
DLQTKTAEEVEAYSKVLWKRYKEIPDWEQWVSKIEKGEEAIHKREATEQALMDKVASYKDPFNTLQVPYTTSTGNKSYNTEEDRFMICMLAKLGLNTEMVYDSILREIRMAPQFRFDWFIKSRLNTDIQKRCNQLLIMLEKEIEENAGNKSKKQRR